MNDVEIARIACSVTKFGAFIKKHRGFARFDRGILSSIDAKLETELLRSEGFGVRSETRWEAAAGLGTRGAEGCVRFG
jgi:hypothetical protein